MSRAANGPSSKIAALLLFPSAPLAYSPEIE